MTHPRPPSSGDGFTGASGGGAFGDETPLEVPLPDASGMRSYVDVRASITEESRPQPAAAPPIPEQGRSWTVMAAVSVIITIAIVIWQLLS